jgi:D-alanyl-D-alanine carboxypeptidase
MDAILRNYYRDLGITAEHLSKNKLSFCEQANLNELEVVDIDFAGRPFILSTDTAKAWRNLCAAATTENVLLNPASGFRSYLYQMKLIESQLTKGRRIDEILTANAIPGFSEHHTGRAVDICADPSLPDSEFHHTDTYRWMLENAAHFNFRLSYPRDNKFGIIFEPWHWFFTGP